MNTNHTKLIAIEKIEKYFLEKYIVPNYFLPEHLGVEQDEIDEFKEFVIKWACSGELNEIMAELLENFRNNKINENKS